MGAVRGKRFIPWDDDVDLAMPYDDYKRFIEACKTDLKSVHFCQTCFTKLIVGVTTDELATYKGKVPLIPFEERLEIVRACRYVDAVVPQSDMDKLAMCKKLNANIMFVGDDWFGTEKWKAFDKQFAEEGIRIVYFPYTKGISSTELRNKILENKL